MVNMGSCTATLAAKPAIHHLILPSLLLPVCCCLFSDRQNKWKEKAKGGHGRGSRILVGRLFAGHGGDGFARTSDVDLHAAAARAASIRFQESHRPDPLFIDLYAGCLLPTGVTPEDESKEQYPMFSSCPCHYTLATKFIDDQLLSLLSGTDDIKQIVLLTDGFDTRSYRLRWPPRTIIFDISPESIFKVALQKLESVGAKIMKTCKLVHIPLESHDLQAALCDEGFDDGRPSLWVIQGLPLLTSAKFRGVLSVVSNLAMKGCIFVGELPGWLVDTEIGSKITVQEWMSKIFMSKGFRAEIIDYNEVGKIVHGNSPPGECNNILFVAEQLQFSDKQMENWRMAFSRMEEEGDEEGFEDLL